MNEFARVSSIIATDAATLIFKIEDKGVSITGASDDNGPANWGRYFTNPAKVQAHLDLIKEYGEEPSLLSSVFSGTYTKIERFPLDQTTLAKYKEWVDELKKSGKIRTVMVKLPTMPNEEK